MRVCTALSACIIPHLVAANKQALRSTMLFCCSVLTYHYASCGLTVSVCSVLFSLLCHMLSTAFSLYPLSLLSQTCVFSFSWYPLCLRVHSTTPLFSDVPSFIPHILAKKSQSVIHKSMVECIINSTRMYV